MFVIKNCLAVLGVETHRHTNMKTASVYAEALDAPPSALGRRKEELRMTDVLF